MVSLPPFAWKTRRCPVSVNCDTSIVSLPCEPLTVIVDVSRSVVEKSPETVTFVPEEAGVAAVPLITMSSIFSNSAMTIHVVPASVDRETTISVPLTNVPVVPVRVS